MERETKAVYVMCKSCGKLYQENISVWVPANAKRPKEKDCVMREQKIIKCVCPYCWHEYTGVLVEAYP